ncbi:Uncharacterised protein [uncultured archaeon]|nr:Uncharacterised protein [uncultured archaeon]
MKGQVFTLEALIALLFLASSFTVISALKQETRSDLYDYVSVADTFEVLEKQYHVQLADSCRTGALSPDVTDLFRFIEGQTGKRMFVDCGRLAVPNDCDPSLAIIRMTTYDEFGTIVWRRVSIGICR